MSGTNKVFLKGNLGRDPEVRYTPDGVAIARFPLATSERWKDRDGNRRERTEWHRVVAFRQVGEIAGKYLAKGSKVMVWGKIRTSKYDKDGETRYSTEIHVDEIELLDPRKDSDTTQSSGPSSNQARESNPAQNAAPQSQASGDDDDFFDDDIPF